MPNSMHKLQGNACRIYSCMHAYYIIIYGFKMHRYKWNAHKLNAHKLNDVVNTKITIQLAI